MYLLLPVGKSGGLLGHFYEQIYLRVKPDETGITWTSGYVVVVVVLLFYVHGKHLRSCRDSQLT